LVSLADIDERSIGFVEDLLFFVPPPKEDEEVGETKVSSKVFQFLQLGHCPTHWGLSYPQE
jgi:hypothetical protein